MSIQISCQTPERALSESHCAKRRLGAGGMRQLLQPGAGGGACASIQSSRRRHRHSISLQGGVGGLRRRRRPANQQRSSENGREACLVIARRAALPSPECRAVAAPTPAKQRGALRPWSKALMVPVSAVSRERPAGINANDHGANIQRKWPPDLGGDARASQHPVPQVTQQRRCRSARVF